MGFETQDVDRKILAILKVLRELHEPAGARLIARRLEGYGVYLSERAVRYHLKLMDERGVTQLVGKLDGLAITEKGINEIKSARVRDKVGFAISRIETLAFMTNFNYENGSGVVPMNITFFHENAFKKALKAMKPVFNSGLCVSNLVAIAESGEQLGDLIIPEDTIGLATVCSVVLNGVLLKAGIPMDSRFGGILQMQNGKPVRFTEIIHYNGSSLDPSEIFIKAKMTAVKGVISTGEGKILANFREIPAACRPVADEVVDGLTRAGLNGLLMMGHTSEAVCEIPVDLNRIGIVLLGGLNPIAAAEEAGVEVENHSMSTIMEYSRLKQFQEL